MRLGLLTVVLLVQSFKSFAVDCRDAVVEAYTSLEVSIERNSFSTKTFAETGLSIEEFNLLSTEEQTEVYTQIMPMQVMVNSTIMLINEQIGRFAGTFYEIYVIDKLQLWREKVDQLRSCAI